MEENHIKLSGTNEWNLVLKDGTDFNAFVTIVEKFSKCSSQASGAHVSGSVKTDFVVSEEEKNVSAPPSQIPPNVNPFTAPPTSSVSKSVFEKITKSSLPPQGKSMPSENDVITDDITENTVPKPSTDEDNDLIAPLVPSVDYGLRSSTPTNVDSFNAGLQQDILESNTVRSVFVGGMALAAISRHIPFIILDCPNLHYPNPQLRNVEIPKDIFSAKPSS